MRPRNWDTYLNAIRFIQKLDRRYEPNASTGWVYILRNREFSKPLLKIGMTRRPPHERAAELGSTSTPGRFELIYFVHVSDARAAERLVHNALARTRYRSNKEFFAVSVGRAVQVLDAAVREFPLLRSQRNKGSRHPRSKPIPQAFGSDIYTCRACGKKNRVRQLAIEMTPACGSCGDSLLT